MYSQLHPFDPREATNEEHANHALLTYALDQLYKSQDKSENAVVPNVFVQVGPFPVFIFILFCIVCKTLDNTSHRYSNLSLSPMPVSTS